MTSTAMMTALLASTATVVVGTTVDGTITVWSAGAEAVYGWTADQVLGRPIDVIVPEDRRPEAREIEARVLAGEDTRVVETVRVARDGTRVEVSLHVLGLRDDQGQVVGTVRLHLDLRPVRSVQAALERAESGTGPGFEDSPVPQARTGLDGSVRAVNAALEALLGRRCDELVGTAVSALLVPDGPAGAAESLARLAGGRDQYVRREVLLDRPDGPRAVVATTTAVPGPRGVELLTSFEDVTELREAESRIRSDAVRFDALVMSMPVAVFTYDHEGRCTSSRGLALRHLGLQDDELVGQDLVAAYGEQPEVRDAFLGSLEGRHVSTSTEYGGRSWQGHYRPITGPGGEVAGGIGIAIDMTERAAAEAEVRANEARLRSLLRHASDVALVLDASGRVVFASASIVEQLGYGEAELFWRSAADYHHEEDREVIASAWRSVLRRPGATARFECRVRHVDGSWRWAEHVLTNLLDDPAVGGVVVNLRETTARRDLDEELRRMALHDGLTGLANRVLLLDRVEQAMAWARRDDHALGLVLLDVVGMTGLNAVAGSDGGDAVLRSVADRLREALPDIDTVARVGSDEFAVLIEFVPSAEHLRSRAAVLRDAVRGPVEVGGRSLELDVRVGSAISPAADGTELLLAAERALRQPAGSSRVVVARAAEGEQRRGAETADLARGIAAGELELCYQPVLELADGRVAGAEALVRWRHPQRGLLQPGSFVPLAEETGLVVDLGAWVLGEACRTAAVWQAAGRGLSIGVNLSPRQLVGRPFLDLVRDALAATGLSPERLVLEVTESALMDDAGATEQLLAVREIGVRLALDDFGTGYSSLTYLKRFPVDAIKVDRSFVAGLGKDADDEAIVASVVSLGRAVGKTVVAEGVETPGQLATLRALGVDQGQGFLWSPAVPADAFTAWLDERGQPERADPMVAPVSEPARARAAAVPDADTGRILDLLAQGASLHTIAAALNAEGRRTPSRSRWSTKTVARVVAAVRAPV